MKRFRCMFYEKKKNLFEQIFLTPLSPERENGEKIIHAEKQLSLLYFINASNNNKTKKTNINYASTIPQVNRFTIIVPTF